MQSFPESQCTGSVKRVDIAGSPIALDLLQAFLQEVDGALDLGGQQSGLGTA